MSENTTTKRHPRTLAEAFPDERAEWLDAPVRPERALIPLVVGLIAALIAGVLIALEASGRLGF